MANSPLADIIAVGRCLHKDVEHGLHVKLGGIWSSYPSPLPSQHFKGHTLTLRNMHEPQLMSQCLVEPREECVHPLDLSAD